MMHQLYYSSQLAGIGINPSELEFGVPASGASGLQAAPPLGLLMLAVHSGPCHLPPTTITCGNGSDNTSPGGGRMA
jgi:hypothetical protein